MNLEILKYNEMQELGYKEICNLIAQEIDNILANAENEMFLFTNYI